MFIKRILNPILFQYLIHFSDLKKIFFFNLNDR